MNVDNKESKEKAFYFQLQKTHEMLEKYTMNYEMMMNINKMKKESFYIEENIKNNQNLIEMLKKIISQKHNDIQLCSSILNMCKDNYKEKKNNVDLEK